MPTWTAPKLPPPANTKAVFGRVASVEDDSFEDGFKASAISADPRLFEPIMEAHRLPVSTETIRQSTGPRRSPISAPMSDTPERAAAPKIGFVSLGCPKALVDSERIITRLRAEGYELSASYQDADAVVVNTCGFLNSAKEELLAAIGEALAENGRVIVTGCLGVESERIRAAHPQVLAITGPHQYEAVVEEIHKAVPRPHDPFLDLVPPQGVRLTPRHYAYVKISEGCNNTCSFCIIPSLRGRLKSRALGDVMGEAERLVAAGVKELLVISQDTSAYGLDLGYAKSAWRGHDYETRFLSLAQALGSLGVWVRLHYVYPYPHVDHVLPLMADGQSAALSRHSLSACEPHGLEGDAASRPSREDLGAHRALAGDLSRPCHPLDLHRGLPRRDRGRFRAASRLARRGETRTGGLLQI